MTERIQLIESALRKWVMFNQGILQGYTLKKDRIKERVLNNKLLEQNGLKDIYISNITKEAYILCFSDKGNQVEKIITLQEELSA